MVRFSTCSNASEFLRLAGTFLAADEVVNALPLGLARRLVNQPEIYGRPAYFAVVTETNRPAGDPEQVVLTGLMTPPHNLILAARAEPEPEAFALIARDLLARQQSVAGAFGVVPLAERFAAQWQQLAGAQVRPGLDERLYRLDKVMPPGHPCTGNLRPATANDVDLVFGWMDAFQREAVPNDSPVRIEDAHSHIEAQATFLWETPQPVSMVMKSRPTAHGVTVNYVYTPPELRGRGYATCAVAALSQHLLDAGFDYCTLFTNLANPTSNDIYQQIGYRPVCDFKELRFSIPS